jgi:NO-binding membrane sensor protein with MHYT domain
MPTAEVEQFSYGVTNPIIAAVMAYFGCLLGLVCTAHARTLPAGVKRVRWLVAGATAIGAAGLWLMHMMAVLGFEVEGTPMRYDLGLVAGSLVAAVAVVTFGILVVGTGRRSATRLILGGTLTGLGLAAQHFTGMAAIHINGHFSYDNRLVAAAVGIGVVASTLALWFTVSARKGVHFLGAAAVMALAVMGMHYTAVFAMHAHVDRVPHTVSGLESTSFVLPIFALAVVALICLLFAGLNILGDDEFRLRVSPAALAAPAETTRPLTGAVAAIMAGPRRRSIAAPPPPGESPSIESPSVESPSVESPFGEPPPDVPPPVPAVTAPRSHRESRRSVGSPAARR